LNSSLPVWRVDLVLKPSRIFLAIGSGLHLGAMMSVLLSELSMPLQAALLLSVLLSLNHVRRVECRKDADRVHEREDGWWLQSGSRAGVVSLSSSSVWRYLVLMDFRGRDQHGRKWRQRIVILPDTVPAATFRRLRIRLQYGHRLNPLTDSAHRFL
jgi:hypothetical protein